MDKERNDSKHRVNQWISQTIVNNHGVEFNFDPTCNNSSVAPLDALGGQLMSGDSILDA